MAATGLCPLDSSRAPFSPSSSDPWMAGLHRHGELANFKDWRGAEVANFISKECNLPQYAHAAEMNFNGALMQELAAHGFLGKGLTRAGIRDFDHVRRILTAVQTLEAGPPEEQEITALPPDLLSEGLSAGDSTSSLRPKPPSDCNHLLRRVFSGPTKSSSSTAKSWQCPACVDRSRRHGSRPVTPATPAIASKSQSNLQRGFVWSTLPSTPGSTVSQRMRSPAGGVSPLGRGASALAVRAGRDLLPQLSGSISVTSRAMQRRSLSEGAVSRSYQSTQRRSPLPWVGVGGSLVPRWCVHSEKKTSSKVHLAKSVDQYVAGKPKATGGVPSAPRGSLMEMEVSDQDTTEEFVSDNWLQLPGEASLCARTSRLEEEKRLAHEQNQDLVAKIRFLEQVPLLRRLPRDQHPMLASACVRTAFASGEAVISQGEAGQSFFVIESGKASVTVDGNQVATLRAGDYFGERALLFQEARCATVVAMGPLHCYEITRKKFQDLGLNSRLHFANRRAVAGRTGGKIVNAAPLKAPSSKSPEERDLIEKSLRANSHLQAISALGAHQVQRLVDIAWREEVEAGCIPTESLAGDRFYIVQDGSFEEVSVDVEISTRRRGSKQRAAAAAARRASVEVTLRRLSEEIKENGTPQQTIPALNGAEHNVGRGGTFGELALLHNSPISSRWKARTRAVVWVIDRHHFKNILVQAEVGKLQEYVKYLDTVSIFSSLCHEEKECLAQAFVEMRFSKDEVILKQGEPGNAFYVLFDGEVEVVKDGEQVQKLCASISTSTAQYFGERALLEQQTRTATVRVTSETARVLMLDRETFDLVLGPLQDIIKQDQSGKRQHRESASAPESRLSSKAPGAAQIRRADLISLGLLGCGGFASVELCEHKVTGKTYALKKVSKGLLIELGLKDSIMSEKSILFAANSPFIIRLHETYNGAQSVYLLLDVALGGELYAIYKHHGLDGSAEHARYYTGSVLFAFEHLHARHVIYRDLKPENLLLTDSGHLKVTDMGLAKFVVGKTFTCCGTPDYFAPELISSLGHTSALDWWTWGVLLYELMSGVPPFEAERPMSTYRKVLEGIDLVVFPEHCEGPVSDLIHKVLDQEPTLRLPVRPGGTQNVKDHPWFAGFSWLDLERRTMEVPYLPTVKSNKDLTNFSDWEAVLPKAVPYLNDGSGWDRDFATVEEPDMAPSEAPEEDDYDDEEDDYDEEEVYASGEENMQ